MTCRKTVAKSPKAPTKDASCSFCGKGHQEVRKLIAGPGVNICDECVTLCSGMVAEDRAKKLAKKSKKPKDV